MYISNLKMYISRLSLYIFRLKIENCIKCHEVLCTSFIRITALSLHNTNHLQSYTTDKDSFSLFFEKQYLCISIRKQHELRSE